MVRVDSGDLLRRGGVHDRRAAFANGFSAYMWTRGRGEYHATPDEPALRSHPVTWLRVKLVADRARQLACAADADALERSWADVASALGVTEDYYGYFEESLLEAVRKTVSDMLTETNPRTFRARAEFLGGRAPRLAGPSVESGMAPFPARSDFLR